MIFADFHFLRPEWLILIPALLTLIYFFKKQILSSGNWHNLIEPHLMPYVLSQYQLKESKYKWWLIFLIGMLVIFSLSGPTWKKIEQPAFRTDQSLVIALDLSRSMNAQDVNPNRITRGKLKILDILKKRRGAQIALIVYSANAFTVTPLTTDSETIAALVSSLDTNIMPSRGSYPAAAIDKGLQLLRQASVVNGEILLITDGGSSSAALNSATNLKNMGYSLSILGVGTFEGAPIPQNDGGFITDRNGQIALARLDREGLSELAQIGGGKYMNMTIDDQDIDLILSNQANSNSDNEELLATDQWSDIGPWFLLVVVPIASLAFRKRWIF